MILLGLEGACAVRTSTVAEAFSRLRKILLAVACWYSRPMRLASSRYKALAMRVICRSKSTFMPIIDERASTRGDGDSLRMGLGTATVYARAWLRGI
jgi:hypothetical protein